MPLDMLERRLEQANDLQAWCGTLVLECCWDLHVSRPTRAPCVDVANGIGQNVFLHRAHFFASKTCERPKPLVSASAEAILVDFEMSHSWTQPFIYIIFPKFPKFPISSRFTNAIPGILLFTDYVVVSQ